MTSCTSKNDIALNHVIKRAAEILTTIGSNKKLHELTFENAVNNMKIESMTAQPEREEAIRNSQQDREDALRKAQQDREDVMHSVAHLKHNDDRDAYI